MTNKKLAVLCVTLACVAVGAFVIGKTVLKMYRTEINPVSEDLFYGLDDETESETKPDETAEAATEAAESVTETVEPGNEAVDTESETEPSLFDMTGQDFLNWHNWCDDNSDMVNDRDTSMFDSFFEKTQYTPSTYALGENAEADKYVISVTTSTGKHISLEKDGLFDPERIYYGMVNANQEVICEKFVNK